MTWARASKQDYEALMELGNPGWGWDDWLPYMLKSEAMNASLDPQAKANLATFDPKYHSSDGPVQLSFVSWLGGTHQPFFKALNSLGINDNPDSASLLHELGHLLISSFFRVRALMSETSPLLHQ
jgi:choline dehydrogenase-like flavoprotein